MSEIFSGRQVDDLIKLLITAARESQTLHTDPIFASVDGEGDKVAFIHTIAPLAMRAARRLIAYFSMKRLRVESCRGG
jgi:hypothetical protein